MIKWLPSWFPFFWFGAEAVTIYPWIFLSKKLLNQHLADLIEHEKVHLKQQKKDGIKFFFKYIFSKKARYEYELEAYAHQILFLATPGSKPYLIEQVARLLSSSMYFRMVTFSQAKKDLEKKLSGIY